MCKVMEDMRNEAAREAAREATLCIARRMLKIGKYSYEDIADVLKISVDTGFTEHILQQCPKGFLEVYKK